MVENIYWSKRGCQVTILKMEKIELLMALCLLVLVYGIAGQAGMMQANAVGITKRRDRWW